MVENDVFGQETQKIELLNCKMRSFVMVVKKRTLYHCVQVLVADSCGENRLFFGKKLAPISCFHLTMF